MPAMPAMPATTPSALSSNVSGPISGPSNGVATTPAALGAASDAQLVERSRRGDTAAYGHLVERYQGLVRAAAISASGHFAAAEELAQEAFITAWTRLDELREPGRFASWVCGITRNHARYQRRHDSRHAPGATSARASATMYDDADGENDRLTRVPSPSPSPLDDAIAREERGLMRAALEEIPLNYREPLLLFYGQERSIADVASHLGISRDTVKQRLHRGRKHLQNGMRQLMHREMTRPLGTAAAVLVAIAGSARAQAAIHAGSASAASAGGTAGLSLSLATAAKVGVGVAVALAAGVAIYIAASSGQNHSESPRQPASQAHAPTAEPTSDQSSDMAIEKAGVTSVLADRPVAVPDRATTAPADPGPGSAEPAAETSSTGESRVRRRSSERAEPATPAAPQAAAVPTVIERGPASVLPPHLVGSRPGPSVDLGQALDSEHAPTPARDPKARKRPHQLPIPPPDFADRIADSDF